MTVFDHHDTRSLQTRPGALARRLADLASAGFGRLRARAAESRRRRLDRQAFLTLLGKEDWLYRDVGVSRADIEWAARLPLHMNAARELDRLRDRVRMGR